MSGLIDIKVPDIGDFKDVPVIEVFVKPGDKVKAEDPLVALESDKATMEVPSPRDGVVKSVVVKVGDKVSEGVVIVQFEGAGAEQSDARPVVSAPPSPISGAPTSWVTSGTTRSIRWGWLRTRLRARAARSSAVSR